MTRIFRALLIALMVCMAQFTFAEDWPQWMGPQRDGVWREDGIMQSFPPSGPKILWRANIGAGYSSPTVAGGKVFIHDRQVKTDGPKAPNPFKRITIPGVERIVCLDQATGKSIWTQEYSCDYTMSYNAGPRAAPLVEADRVYTFGGEGDLQCRQVSDGKLIWQKSLAAEHTPNWGFSASPMIEGDKLIAVGGDPQATVVAFNKITGEKIWGAIPAKEPGYSSPTIIEAGGKRQLIIWNPEALNSLDPQTGKIYWSQPFTSGAGMSIATPRREGDLLFVTAFYNGAMMMKLDKDKPAATQLWKIGGKSERKTEALHAVMCTPVIEGDYIYGVCSYGQLRCLKLQTGERVWETLAVTTTKSEGSRWANAFINRNADRYFIFNETGDLIIANLSPAGYKEISRAHLIDPTNQDPGRLVVWSQPAYADRCVFVRNDKEIVCASLAAEGK